MKEERSLYTYTLKDDNHLFWFDNQMECVEKKKWNQNDHDWLYYYIREQQKIW